MKPHLVLLHLAVLCVGCGGGPHAQPARDGDPSLPMSLPAESAQPAITTPAHAASALVDVVIPGDQYFQKNEASTPGPGNLTLTHGPGGFAWVIYEVPNIAADYRPTSLEITVIGTSVSYYVALANYARQRWEYLPGVQQGTTYTTIGDWDAYASPSSSLYYAIMVAGANLTILHSVVAVADTRLLPAPQGLTAAALLEAAELSWDLYADPRADELRLYEGQDAEMTGAVLVDTLAVELTSRVVSGLTGEVTYYYALTAYWAAELMESEFSNVASVTPTSPVPITLSGLWPRRGNREDNRGCTSYLGPPRLATYTAVDVADGRETVANRTTPALDDEGNVFAVSGDAVLTKYSADLSVKLWEFAASDYGTAGADYICPPHSPVLDSEGGAYFVAAPMDSPGALAYVFGIEADGSFGWRFDAVRVPTDLDTPYPTPNITADGMVVAVVNDKRTVVGIDDEGGEAWRYDFGESREVHADPAITERGTIEMPVWYSGFGTDPREHWISLSATDGSFVANYSAMGSPANVYSGLPLPDATHVYPELDRLVLLDAAAGTFADDELMILPLTAAPARDNSGSYVFQAHPPYGIANMGDMRCYQVNTGATPPSIESLFIRQLDRDPLTSQPAVDGANTIYMPDAGGRLYRIEFDKDQPIGQDNPQLTDKIQLGIGDSYYFASFAIGDGVAYIITEQNTLYGIGISPEEE